MRTLRREMPPAELESAAFCSASKRSVQLSYEGIENVLRIIYPSADESSRMLNYKQMYSLLLYTFSPLPPLWVKQSSS